MRITYLRSVMPLLAAVLWLATMEPAGATGRYSDWENWMSSATAVVPGRDAKGPLQINVGFGAALGPEYPGSDDVEAKPLPLVDIDYKNTLFASTQRGIGYNIWRTRTTRAGPRITWDFGRESSEHPEIASLPDIDPAIEAGLYLESYVAAWRIRLDARQDLADGHGGFLINGDLAWGSRWSKRSSIIVGARTTYMGEDYAQSYFGVDTANATASLPAFSADAGFRDVTAYIQIVFDVSKSLYVSVEGRGSLLLEAAADSPITDSSQVFSGAAIVGYRF